jgi:hypothetical protein
VSTTTLLQHSRQIEEVFRFESCKSIITLHARFNSHLAVYGVHNNAAAALEAELPPVIKRHILLVHGFQPVARAAAGGVVMLVHRAVLVAPERVGPELDDAILVGGDLEEKGDQ